MHRRDFLKLITATAAAATLGEVAALVPVPVDAPVALPPIDWAHPHVVELAFGGGGVPRWLVDGVCINGDPAVVQKVSRIVSGTGATLAPLRFIPIQPVDPDDVEPDEPLLGFIYQEVRDPSGPTYGVYNVDGFVQTAALPVAWGGIGVRGDPT